MKVAYSQSNVTSSEGVQTTSAFGIARTPHMFNILSSGLYSDKIAAVLREISCNAMDAHIMGGTPDKPFQVKLPTSLDRSFYVKDWGPGLNDQEVRELYTTYGWSSKQNSDDVTGAFGLGSKSPFAYTTQNEEDSDGFTIVAVKDGVKRIYTCHIGEEGAPAISRLHEGPADADWPHGVMVTFPVQSRDIGEFHQKAVEIFQWFRVKPEMLGLNRQLVTPEFEYEGSIFSMKRVGHSNDMPNVITGNVRYPINQHRLGDLTEVESALLKSNIHLFLPIGQVMMTPSREELQYTEQTKTNLKKHLAAAALEVAQRVREDVMTPEATKWEWFKKIQTYCETLPYGVKTHLKAFLSHAGLPADEIDLVIKTVDEKTAEVPTWVGDGISGPTMEFKRDVHNMLERDSNGNLIPLTTGKQLGARVYLYHVDPHRGTVRRREIVHGKVYQGGDSQHKVNLSFVDDVRVYYTDSTLADQRVRALMREGVCKYALLVTSCKGTPQEYAAEYATRLVGPKGMDGLPMYGVASLDVPSEVEQARERRRQLKELGPRASYADQEVDFVSINGNVTRVTLGEMEEGTMYYMVATKLGSEISRGTIRNKTDTHDYQFSGSSLRSVMQGIEAVVNELDLAVPGIILVQNESTARRMKFAEQGILPFMPYFVPKLKENKDRWLELVKNIDRTPKVDLTHHWYARNFGWLGMLGRHRLQKSALWTKFTATFPNSPVTRAVIEFADKCALAEKESQKVDPLLTALLGLSAALSNHGLPDLSVTAMTHYEVKRVFDELAPSFECLDISRMEDWMNSEVDKSITMLRTVMEMDNVTGDTGNSQVLLVA